MEIEIEIEIKMETELLFNAQRHWIGLFKNLVPFSKRREKRTSSWTEASLLKRCCQKMSAIKSGSMEPFPLKNQCYKSRCHLIPLKMFFYEPKFSFYLSLDWHKTRLEPLLQSQLNMTPINLIKNHLGFSSLTGIEARSEREGGRQGGREGGSSTAVSSTQTKGRVSILFSW